MLCVTLYSIPGSARISSLPSLSTKLSSRHVSSVPECSNGVTSDPKETFVATNTETNEPQIDGSGNVCTKETICAVDQSEKDYVCVVKKVKKENITPDNIGEIMLCQIPGVSSVTALAIMGKYKSLPVLIKELDENVDCLKDIKTCNSKGQLRKINKTSILNVVKFLLKK